MTRPSAFGGILLIARRELGTYFGGRSGYIIGAATLLITGVLFNVHAVGTGSKYSSEVLGDFFYDTSGMVMIAAVLLSMRLLAEERQSGTLPLLLNSSLTEGEIVFAKWLSGVIFLAVLTLVTIYMPLLIFVRGKVSIGHIAAGYTGLILLGSLSAAIGTYGSALARSQLIAAIISGVLVVLMLLLWMLARRIDGPLGDIVGYASIHDKHFRPFQQGSISTKDVLFYVSTTALFLFLARNALEARRWSS